MGIQHLTKERFDMLLLIAKSLLRSLRQELLRLESPVGVMRLKDRHVYSLFHQRLLRALNLNQQL